jgi:hypothetical protein
VTSSSVSAISYSGGIAGSLGGGGTITNCDNSGNIYSSYYSGGVVGQLSLPSSGSYTVTITNSYNTGGISSDFFSGGIVGHLYSFDSSAVTIKECYNIGNISSSRSSGGIVGDLSLSSSDSIVTIIDCYNVGDVSSSSTSNDSYSGGIVGHWSSSGSSTVTVTNCYNIGNVSSFRYSGGTIGYLYLSGSSTVTVTNNAAINAEVEVDGSSSNKYLGRIVGYLSGTNITVSNNFALESMQAVGGSFNTNPANHGVSKTEVQLKSRSTYENAINGDGLGGLGWLFGDDDEHPWKMPEGGPGYPILYWQE